MSNDFVHLYNRKDNRSLYYDFKEKKFFRDRSANKQFKPNIWYFLAIALTLNVDGFFTIEKNPLINIFVIFLSVSFATVLAYILYRKITMTLLDNQTVPIYFSASEFDVLIPQVHKLFKVQLIIEAFFIIAFIVSLLLFIAYVKIALLILAMTTWFLVVLVFLWINPYKRIVFFQKYKKGEIVV